MSLHIELKPGQAVQIGDVRVVLEHKSGQKARLSVAAPANVRIVKDPPPNTGDKP